MHQVGSPPCKCQDVLPALIQDHLCLDAASRETVILCSCLILNGRCYHADNLEAAEGWVDAILMAAHIAAGKQLPALAHALTVEIAP